ncbi:MAG TPA: hypothetical protein VF272_00175 [Candidatus Saccharimonadia bacterium]
MNRSIARSLFFGFLIILGCYWIWSHPVQAESSGGVVISPPFQQVVVGDGKGTAFDVTVTNRTTSDQSITATTVDFKSLDESGGVAFLGSEISELERKYGLANWLKLDAAPTIIPAGASKKIVVNLENREDLTPGGHYGAVIFKIEGDNASENSNSVDVKQVLASLIFAKKLGGERYDLKLSSLDPPPKLASGDQKVKLRFYNPGNVHVVPRGILRLKDSKGKVITTSLINQESGILLPESYRVYPVILKNIPVLPAGKYVLEAEYRYDGIEQTAKLTKEITIFDWRYAAFLGAVGSVSLVPLLLIRKFIAHRRRKKHKGRRKHYAAF